MKGSIRIARELMRIAKMISASNATINGYDECVNYLGGMFEDGMIDDGGISYNVDMDYYETNGGSVCAMRIKATKDGLYYNEYVVTDDDVEEALREKWQSQERIGDEYEFSCDLSDCLDDQYVLYSKYPFDTGVFEKWLEEKAEKNAEAGLDVVRNNDTFKLYNIPKDSYVEMDNGVKIWRMDIPTWAICYLVNGDKDGLTEEDIETADDWWNKNNVVLVDPIGAGDASFSSDPEFGPASDVEECFVHTR